MWFHAISSHGDLLVLLSKGLFTLERVDNIVQLGKNSPCPALGTSLRSAVSCTEKKTDALETYCREEVATTLLLFPSLLGNSTAKYVTPKAEQDESGFQRAQLHNSGVELNSSCTQPYLAMSSWAPLRVAWLPALGHTTHFG